MHEARPRTQADPWSALPAEVPAPAVGESRGHRGATMPFPVEVPFKVRSDLQRLGEGDHAREAGHGQALLLADARLPLYLQAKRRHLSDPMRPLAMRAPDAGADRLAVLVRALLDRLAARHPEMVRSLPARGAEPGGWIIAAARLRLDACSFDVQAMHPDATPLLDGLRAIEPAIRGLAALALGVQEDVVLMGRPAGAGGPHADGLRALAMSVVFPSGWEPRLRLGQSLHEIHQPVADGDRLRQASLNLSRAMVEKGPFERHVWTIAADSRLARWPGEAAPPSPAATAESPHDALADLWFRCERQITLGLPEHQAGVFLIRVMLEPLASVADTVARRARLVASLRSMSDAVVDYKNLRGLRERVCAAWGAVA